MSISGDTSSTPEVHRKQSLENLIQDETVCWPWNTSHPKSGYQILEVCLLDLSFFSCL